MKIKKPFVYVTCIRQVAALLGYGEPQVLEVFKNTLPSRLSWVLFPVEDLRQSVETTKRIVSKAKIDRWLAGQSTSTPFMSIQDNTVCNKRKSLLTIRMFLIVKFISLLS